MIIEVKKLKDLKAADYNPRVWTDEAQENLKKSLSKFGLVEPIVYNKKTGRIVGGHFRVAELMKMGIKEAHCVIVDLEEADEKELNIRLNANTGAWDYLALESDWNHEDLREWGMNIWTEDELDLDDFFAKKPEDEDKLHRIIFEYKDLDHAKVIKAIEKTGKKKEALLIELLNIVDEEE